VEDRAKLRDMMKIVVKVGTTSLTNENGLIDCQKIDLIAEVLSKIRQKGKKTILVTSGAIAVGAAKMGFSQRPSDLFEKQALAAIGQAELINMYARSFDRFNQKVAQVLLTKDGITNPIRRENTRSTLNTLLNMDVIPIINENDSVATDEIEIGDNDTLSAYTAVIVDAELLIILSDIDGLYTGDPRKNPDAQIIYKVPELTQEIEDMASGSGSEFARGGMVTKIMAAKLCVNNGTDMIIAKGDDPSIVDQILEGGQIGTHFISKPSTETGGKKRYFFLGY
jgi:glutamate 5-kinase